MSNRAAHRRRLADLAAATNKLNATDPAPETSTTAPTAPRKTRPRTGRVPMGNREAMFRRTATRISPREALAIRDVVVETMLSIPVFSQSSDRHGIRYLARFATWVYRREGYFDPATQLDDPRLDAWVDHEYAHRTDLSRDSAYRHLRRIRAHMGNGERSPERRVTRQAAKAPHTALEWSRFEATAANLHATYVGNSFRTLLDLTGAAGLRGDEVAKADGTWIHTDGNAVTVRAVNTYGVVRYVPVFGPAAERLAAYAGTKNYLVLRNKITSRHNAVSALVKLVNKHTHGGAVGFSVTSARHMWLTRLAQSPIRFTTLAAVADVNPGSHTIADLLGYVAWDDPAAAAADLRDTLPEAAPDTNDDPACPADTAGDQS